MATTSLLKQGSADSNFSQRSSDLSLDEEREVLRRETERQALTQLEKARVSVHFMMIQSQVITNYLTIFQIIFCFFITFVNSPNQWPLQFEPT